MKRVLTLVIVIALTGLATTGTACAETLTQTFKHVLIVNTPPQSFEHRIDLPDAAMQAGQVFNRRRLKLDGRLVIEREELTRTWYYVKVRLPKHPAEPMMGELKVELDYGAPIAPPPLLPAPTHLQVATISAALRPAFTWKGEGKYTAFTLYDLDADKTVMERVAVIHDYTQVSEGWLEHHRYRWAVRQADETGRYGPEAQAAFRIAVVNGIVTIIPE